MGLEFFGVWIPGVIYRELATPHIDGRRTIRTVFDGDDELLYNFAARQMKLIYPNGEKIVLGDHYHRGYRECYIVLSGEAQVMLVSVDDPSLRMEIVLRQGETVFIPPKVAHRVIITKESNETVLIGLTERGWTPNNDIPFDMD